MNRVFLILVILFIGLAGILVVQVSRTQASIILEPHNLLAQSGNISRIRVGGKVTTDKISYKVESPAELKFRIEDRNRPGITVPVIYQGLKPDMFSAGRDVLIDGEYVNGTLIAHKLLTQCPSKYEAPGPADKYKTDSSKEN